MTCKQGAGGFTRRSLNDPDGLPLELLERENDLQVLAVALAKARSGQGCIALVSGEAGIGKTSFIEHFVAAQGPAMCVLKGNCDPLFTPTPLGPLYDIARRSSAALLAQLESETPRAGLFSALFDQFREAREPIIFVVEDIHWADEATLDLIKYLGRRIAQTRALLVLTYRDDEVGAHPSVRMVLGDLAASKAAPGAGPLNASVAVDPLRRSSRVPSVMVPAPDTTVTV